MEEFMMHLPMPMVVVALAAGFVLLIKGADYFVQGASAVAKRFCVPPIIIGLTIVAMGTSLPETAVSATASIGGNNALAISNAVGSNIFNLMVVIGVCAMLTPVAVERQTIVKDIPFSAICAGLLLLFGFIQVGTAPSGEGVMILGRLEGILLLVLFTCYILYLIKDAMKARKNAKGSIAYAKMDKEESVEERLEEQKEGCGLSLPLSFAFIVLGGCAIAAGGQITVDAASRIALDLGMSQTLVGLTIVSIGTSLPELVTSVVAARKNQVDMALGNAIGSNIFNILMVLGMASALSPIEFLVENVIDVVILLVFSLVVWLFAASNRKVNRGEGFLMVLFYAAYAVYIVIR